MTDWKHDALMHDLASFLRGADRMVWCDMQLGPSGSPRPDVFTLQRSYSRPQPSAYEIKVSRSDLRSDTTSGKWQSYLAYAGSVTFAVPDGLCTVADIPEGCGLIVRKAQSWRYVRKPIIQKVALPMDACMKLLIDGVSRVSREREPTPRQIDLWRECEAVRKKFGENVAKAARDLTVAQKRIMEDKQVADELYKQAQRRADERAAYLLEQAKKTVADYESAKRELCQWLGLDENAGVFAVRRAVDSLKQRCNADGRVASAEQRLAHARRSLEHALAQVSPEADAA